MAVSQVNSLEWWEDRFATRWEDDGGPGQTRHFMERLMEALPPRERAWLEARPRSILDWGCALGDGVDALAHAFPDSRVAGLDFSPRAVDRARQRFPDREFLHSADGEIPHEFDVVVCSNCLEHFADPFEVMSRQLRRCTYLYVAMVPFNERELHASHVRRFEESTFPEQLNGFRRLTAVRVVTDPQFWNGEQLVVVYGSGRYAALDLSREMAREQAKWDQEYAGRVLEREDLALAAFNREFAALVSELLPKGGRVLEAGCGAGWQSLALARTGRFDVHLLDFSQEALAYAERLFDREGMRASFLQGDATAAGSPEFDLVFNAGVLEHYTFEQQVVLLKGMKSRSRGYVISMVPSRHCYWYWLWRLVAAAEGRWTFGKEVPISDLAAAFESAGMHCLGQAFVGADWTEQFIEGIPRLDPSLKQAFLEIHRGGIIPQVTKGYLLAGLGGVAERSASIPAVWNRLLGQEPMRECELVASAADALALRVGAESEIRRLRSELEDQRARAREEEIRVRNLCQQLDARETAVQAAETAVAERERLLVEARQAEEQLQQERQAALRQVEAIARTRDALQGTLAQVRGEALAVHDLLEAWRTNKSFRLARMMQLIQRELLRGPLRGRLRFVGDVLGRVIGRRRQLRPLNIFETPMRQVMQIASLADDAARGGGGLPTEGASGMGSVVSPGAQGGYRCIAGNPRRRVVNIVNTLFMDLKGQELMCGGAERYVIELSRMIRELGYTPEIYQCGQGDWTRTHDGVKVVGIDIGSNTWALNERFHARVAPGALSIYSAFFLAAPAAHPNALGIGHGIFWDTAFFQEPPAVREKWLNLFYGSIENCATVVSVDTNTINWLRASRGRLADKCIYVPNFVDTSRFRPREGGDRPDGRLVVLYPRRLYRPRGFWLLAELVPQLIEKYPQVDFHFVGKADEAETKAARALVEKYPGRVRWYHLAPDEMERAYAEADISLIPTIESEGTSLSCLEAMASGNAVIATNVGGLPELVTNGHNGLLIEPTSEGLKAALERLLDDPDLRRRLAETARQVSLAYDIEVWRSRWREVLRHVLPSTTPEQNASRTFVHLDAGGVTWDRMKQRPQHLFRALADAGHEAVFVNDEPHARGTSGTPGLYLVGKEDALRLERPVVYVYLACDAERAMSYPQATVVYDILDDPAIHAGGGVGEHYLACHERLLREADVVITSARLLYERYKKQRPDVRLVPNGVWVDDFRPADRPKRPADMPAPGSPVIGYYGAIAEWFDFELLAHAARQLRDWQFVLIGLTNRKADLDDFTGEHANVHYLGEKPYESLAAYLAHFDVGIIPFLVNDVTNAVSPVKLFEYAAGGKPIVATAFTEVCQYSEVLTAGDGDEFVEQLRRALQLGRDAAYQEKLAALAESNSWQDRAARILKTIEEQPGRSARGRRRSEAAVG